LALHLSPSTRERIRLRSPGHHVFWVPGYALKNLVVLSSRHENLLGRTNGYSKADVVVGF
ncbi:MAG TPA: hypothetical protein VH682_17710, partial [Gemmataceae bacterium]